MLPRPTVLCSRISPPSKRASSRLIESPSPVPPYFRLVVPSACWNASKMMRCLSCAMPIPVSVTENAFCIVGDDWRQTPKLGPRRPHPDRHVRQEVALILGRACKLLSFLSQRVFRSLDFEILGFYFGILVRQHLRLLLQLGVGLLP